MYGGISGRMTSTYRESSNFVLENGKRVQYKLMISWPASYVHPTAASRTDKNASYGAYLYGDATTTTTKNETATAIFYRQ